MATVTRTLKKGADTGKLNRAEVRAVTAAIRAGRTADVLSGAVLQQFRSKKKDYGTFHDHLVVERHLSNVSTLQHAAGKTLRDGGDAKSSTKAQGKKLATPSKSTRVAQQNGNSSQRGKK